MIYFYKCGAGDNLPQIARGVGGADKGDIKFILFGLTTAIFSVTVKTVQNTDNVAFLNIGFVAVGVIAADNKAAVWCYFKQPVQYQFIGSAFFIKHNIVRFKRFGYRLNNDNITVGFKKRVHTVAACKTWKLAVFFKR